MRCTRLSRIRSALGVSALLALSSCAPSGPVRAALYGDLPSLRREIERAERAGKLDRSALRELAEAVAGREVASARGADGVRRVRALRACSRPILPVLRDRSAGEDEVAAEAMLARLAQNDVEPAELVGRYAQATEGAWRAVAARAALDPRDALLRRTYFVDSDERVRRAALEAAVAAPLRADLEAVLEAFRLDPDPLSRSLAARSAGAIGGEASVLGLKDRFARADEQGRLAIVDAWAMPASFTAGGERELRVAAERELGLVSVAAAGALLRARDGDGSIVGLLVQALRHGAEEERRLAILLLPDGDARVLPALADAAKDENADVRVIALARLARDKTHGASATRSLRELAAKKDDIGAQARAALAAAGDRSIVAALAVEVRQAHALRRQSAALALVRLGEPAKAAVALGDTDPGVRVGVSCGVLSVTR